VRAAQQTHPPHRDPRCGHASAADAGRIDDREALVEATSGSARGVEVVFVSASVTIGGGMAPEIVGREEELASVRAFVDEGEEGFAALVLEGEAGIGKSTLWAAGLEHARERGTRVLASWPAEAERRLAYVGLGDLFEDVVDDLLPELPPPRRRALKVALLREDAAGGTVDPRAVAIAVRGALHLLGRERPLVIAIDDVQWFDVASGAALAFAVRRLTDASIRLLLARRVGIGLPVSELEQAIEAVRVERLRIGSLSIGAIHRLLQDRLGRAFPRAALLLLHETSGGNPFYALELARAADAEGVATDPAKLIRIPDSLERLIRNRLSDLSPVTREALSLVAVGGRCSPAMLPAAGVEESALRPAFAAGVIERDEGVIRFTHPLLASALYQELPDRARARAHAALAQVVDDPTARARHRALASSEPDAEVAADIERAGAVAVDRGAIVTARELAEHALRLTPATAAEDRHRRAIGVARMRLDAGDRRRARADAETLLATTGRGRRRAEALVLLSDIDRRGVRERAIALRREALSEANSDAALQASILRWLAHEVGVTEGLRAAEEYARASLRVAEQLGDDGVRAAALAQLAHIRFNAGKSDAPLAEEACRMAAAIPEPKERHAALLHLVHVLTWSCQFDRARTVLEDLYAELNERDERATADALWYLSLVELGAGRFALAASYADRQREIDRLYEIDEQEDPLATWVVARVAAHCGELDRARELAEQGRTLARGQPQIAAGHEGVLGLVAAWSGDPREAVVHFAVADEAKRGGGRRAPSMFWWHAEYVEALLELGRIESAVELLEPWELDATRLGLESVLAQSLRCRGLIAAARGDLDAASALLGDAVVRHDAVGDPFGRARGLLALGIVRRRRRQKRAAREAIQSALEAFDEIGAAGWAARTRAERGRIGGRTREQGLTAAERRVAVLVAEGRTNKEVAAALFLGERTVETHLSHVYAKLGVRSRTELARTFRADEQTSGGLTISS
jgi:DNA-binding CsgD family transcriptional regulator